jgi:hypothetical protein
MTAPIPAIMPPIAPAESELSDEVGTLDGGAFDWAEAGVSTCVIVVI